MSDLFGRSVRLAKNYYEEARGRVEELSAQAQEELTRALNREDIQQVELFLEGRQETLVKALRKDMAVAAEQTQYERAATLRDKIRAIERTMESQKMAAFARTELDLVGIARRDGQAANAAFGAGTGDALRTWRQP